MKDFFEVINERSSIRGYRAGKLTGEELRVLTEAGLRAPSAINRQEIHISVLNTDDPLAKELQMKLRPDADKTFYYGAPYVFFLSGKDDFLWTPVDAGIAVENIHLTAKAMGLGSVILGCVYDVLTGPEKDYFNDRLKVPAGYSFCVALAVGYPDTEKKQHDIDPETHISYIG